MFVRFRLPSNREINVNPDLVRMFEPGPASGSGEPNKSTRLHFSDGWTIEIPFTNQQVRHAFKKARQETNGVSE
jgi:hypothetical protein